jgi:hypothetical protein
MLDRRPRDRATRRCWSSCSTTSVSDYAKWEDEKRRDDGLFWQFDVWDGMEESISGSAQTQERPADDQQLHVAKRLRASRRSRR